MTPISASTGGRPRLPGNNNYKVFEYGARKIGYKNVHTGNMSINSLEYDERPACRQIGFCMSGCAIRQADYIAEQMARQEI